MSQDSGLASYFSQSRKNSVVTWVLVSVLASTIVAGSYLDRYEPVLFSVVAITIISIPVIKYRSLAAVPPWYFVGLLCLSVLWEAYAPLSLQTAIIPSLSLATLGLLIAVELDRFTSLRLAPWFAVSLTVLFTLAFAGLLSMLRWSVDVLFGTSFLLDGRSQDAINAAVMIEFIYATIAGLLAGVIFYLYFFYAESHGSLGHKIPPVSRIEASETDVKGVHLSDRIGISKQRQSYLVRCMQIVLVCLFFYGLYTRQIAVITNAAMAIVITFLPAILERDYHVVIEPGLMLWITTAVFLHTLGTAGLYDTIATWDNITHTLSATVVAATGYAALRAIHLHSPTVFLPRWALFTCLLVFMLAISVIWEILEFVVDQVALSLAMEPILAQHGINDTIVDMHFNLLGTIIVAIWGTIYLTEVAESLGSIVEERYASRERGEI